MRRSLQLLCAAALWMVSQPALAAPPVPSGAHPRIWLDGETLAHLRAEAKRPQSATARAIAGCDRVRREPSRHLVDQYQGFTFSEHLQNCALAWQVTGKKEYAETALVYFQALLDDYKKVGAGDGGDDVVRHDSGYAVRMFGPNAALGYDWLYDAPGMTEALRAHARARFGAWMDWYQAEGYLADKPGANFQAGYVYAATLIAIAQGAEAGAAGEALWQRVVETVFGKEMLPAMASGGILHGGDWPEGWQYGALSVLEYALAMRALQEQGVALAGAEQWGEQLMRRYLHGLTPTGAMFVGGDTQIEAPHLEPSVYPLLAVLVGPATEAARSWARATKQALEVHEEQYPLYEALADARTGPAEPFASDEPTAYFASGTETLYLRSSWSPDAIWAVVQCTPRRRDHQHLNAGNVVLSRGDDHVLVDPSPYDSMSSLTSNAPTVVSKNLPDNYQPSQAPWGEETRMVMAGQAASGVAAARCAYADQYRFKATTPDVLDAQRDVVLVPWQRGGSLVVVDRVKTTTAEQPLALRFRSPAPLELLPGDGDAGSTPLAGASGVLGDTTFTIAPLWASGGTSKIEPLAVGNCYGGVERGKCDAARIPGSQLAIEVPGAAPAAGFLLDAAPEGATTAFEVRETKEYRLAILRHAEQLAVIAVANGAAIASYEAPRGDAHHVVLDPPPADAISATASPGADRTCLVTLTRGGSGALPARPLIFRVDEQCNVASDPLILAVDAPAVVAKGAAAAPSKVPEGARLGCGCRCQLSPAAAAAHAWLVMLVLVVLAPVRKRCGRRHC